MALTFTEEQLNTLDKSLIVNLFLQLQDQNEKLTGEVQELNKKLEVLIEQVTLANKNRFGWSSEKMTDTNQICFMEVDGSIVFFNEAEAVANLDAEEPESLEPKTTRKGTSKNTENSAWPSNWGYIKARILFWSFAITHFFLLFEGYKLIILLL